MDLFLNGQTAVVTGASRGIGPAVTRGLVAEGVRVPARAAPARPGGFSEITDEDWQASLTLNLMAAVRTTRAALPVMLAAGKGAIVTISSANAFLPDPAVMDYSPAKAALASFSKSLSKEAGAASGSTRSARARSPPTCGSATTASRRRSAARPAPGPRTSRATRRTRW